jgi:hypothetical protein
VVPHVDDACIAHSLSGSVLLAMAPQMPSDPDPLRAAVQA